MSYRHFYSIICFKPDCCNECFYSICFSAYHLGRQFKFSKEVVVLSNFLVVCSPFVFLVPSCTETESNDEDKEAKYSNPKGKWQKVWMYLLYHVIPDEYKSQKDNVFS